MSKSTRVIMKTAKKRAEVTGDLVGVRVQPDMAKQLDDWRRKQDDLPGRPEAIRRLVELGLEAQAPTKLIRRSTPNKLRAAELATKEIDGMVDPSAKPEERAQRRRRLTKGPAEFRDDRVDLPKARK
jgi:hypothetical protein